MAEENQPLIDGLEPDAVDSPDPREQINSLYGINIHCDGPVSSLHSSKETFNITKNGRAPHQSESDAIVALFVVAFDTKAGNVIEWHVPDDIDLEGVEFKAMSSGSHTQQRDFVYFRKDSYFGLACFENMPVQNERERGARMKSVGMLSTSYTLLYRHMQFLEKQVRNLLNTHIDSHQLQTPGRYSQLKAFWEDKKGVLARSLTHSESIQSLGIPSPVATPHQESLPEMKVTHPAGCFKDFIALFGEFIFILWKMTLLKKRILFVSSPPIGAVCYRGEGCSISCDTYPPIISDICFLTGCTVYCACCLANTTLLHGLDSRAVCPHFYVSVADIATLETELSYLACTTERIFETKTQLYDLYVDDNKLTSPQRSLQSVLIPSSADRDKLQKLNNHRSAARFSEECGDAKVDEEIVFTSFFTEQNNRLFQTLLDVAASSDRTLTADHMRAMGLEPQGDRAFLMELVETHGIDVMLLVDNPCCPR